MHNHDNRAAAAMITEITKSPMNSSQNFTKDEQSKILASDRSNNYLDTTRLIKLYPEIKNIKDSVRNCLLEYKTTYTLKTLQKLLYPKMALFLQISALVQH